MTSYRRLALLHSRFGAERYRMCIELCPADFSDEHTLHRRANRIQERKSTIKRPDQGNRPIQHFGENCLPFVTE